MKQKIFIATIILLFSYNSVQSYDSLYYISDSMVEKSLIQANYNKKIVLKKAKILNESKIGKEYIDLVHSTINKIGDKSEALGLLEKSIIEVRLNNSSSKSYPKIKELLNYLGYVISYEKFKNIDSDFIITADNIFEFQEFELNNLLVIKSEKELLTNVNALYNDRTIYNTKAFQIFNDSSKGNKRDFYIYLIGDKYKNIVKNNLSIDKILSMSYRNRLGDIISQDALDKEYNGEKGSELWYKLLFEELFEIREEIALLLFKDRNEMNKYVLLASQESILKRRNSNRVSYLIGMSSILDTYHLDNTSYPNKENFELFKDTYLSSYLVPDSIAGKRKNDCNFGYKYELGINKNNKKDFRLTTCLEKSVFSEIKTYDIYIYPKWNRENFQVIESFYVNDIKEWDLYINYIPEINKMSYTDIEKRVSSFTKDELSLYLGIAIEVKHNYLMKENY